MLPTILRLRFEDVQSFENKNTKEKTKRDVKLLEDHLRNKKNDEREVHTIEPVELNKYLAEFILSVRRKAGEDYESLSLICFVSSIEEHLKKNNYTVSIINEKQFKSPFYLGINFTKKDSSKKNWFKSAPMYGCNKLNTLMKWRL